MLQEKFMVKDLPIQYRNSEMDLSGAIQETKTRREAAHFNWTEPTSCDLGI
jgi:hypothetical protein